MTTFDPQPTTTSASAIHLASGEGPTYRMIDGDHVAKAAVRDAEGAFEMFEVIAPARPMAPPHVSPWSAVLYLVEGRITALVGGTTYDVEPGGVVVFPAGTPAGFEVLGDTARIVGVTTGDRAGRFFADFADAVPTDRPAEESIEAILDVTARYGVRLAGG